MEFKATILCLFLAFPCLTIAFKPNWTNEATVYTMGNICYGEHCPDATSKAENSDEEDHEVFNRFLYGRMENDLAYRREIEDKKETYQISPKCERDRKIVAEAQKTNEYVWAMYYWNADAKDTHPDTGALLGRPYALGSYNLCNRIKATGNMTAAGEHDFNAHYCHIRWFKPDNLVGQGEGWCVPESCSREDVKKLMRVRADLPLQYTYCGAKEPLRTNVGGIIALCVIALFGLLVIGGTFLDGYNDMMEAMWGKENEEDEDKLKLPAKPQTPGKAKRALLSFSLLRNIPIVLATGGTRATYGCMNGLRVIAMTWIVLGHTWTLDAATLTDPHNMLIDNYFSQFDLNKTFLHQLVNNMNLAVEVFFFLGGTLVCLSFLKTLKRLEKESPMVRIAEMMLYVFHRYWRLTPLVAALMLIWGNLWQYLAVGPLWPETHAAADNCKKMWWVNLLYIQNLYRGSGECMGWTWYLANDFQYFLVVPIFAFFLYTRRVFGPVFLFLGWLGTTIARAVLISTGVKDGYWDLYVKPWSRFGPYALGIGFGYILYRTKGTKVKMNRFLVLLGWLVAFMVGILVIFGTYLRGNCEGCTQWSIPEGRGYNILRRDAFTLCLAWVVFACVNGYGGYINSFLAWDLFTPLSKLTYCGYLIHPMIHFITLAAREKAVYSQTITMLYQYLGNMAFTLVLSFMLTLVFEIPFLALEKVILPSPKKKKPEPKSTNTPAMTTPTTDVNVDTKKPLMSEDHSVTVSYVASTSTAEHVYINETKMSPADVKEAMSPAEVKEVEPIEMTELGPAMASVIAEQAPMSAKTGYVEDVGNNEIPQNTHVDPPQYAVITDEIPIEDQVSVAAVVAVAASAEFAPKDQVAVADVAYASTADLAQDQNCVADASVEKPAKDPVGVAAVASTVDSSKDKPVTAAVAAITDPTEGSKKVPADVAAVALTSSKDQVDAAPATAEVSVKGQATATVIVVASKEDLSHDFSKLPPPPAERTAAAITPPMSYHAATANGSPNVENKTKFEMASTAL